jgi:hypothetical protein
MRRFVTDAFRRGVSHSPKRRPGRTTINQLDLIEIRHQKVLPMLQVLISVFADGGWILGSGYWFARSSAIGQVI